ERLATQDVDLLVRAVDHDGEPLRGVGREADVPYRSAAEGLLRDERFLDERSVGLEDLQPVVRAIADVDEPVVRNPDGVDDAELRRRRAVRIEQARPGLVLHAAGERPRQDLARARELPIAR